MKVKWLKMKKSSFVEGTFIATAAIIFVKILGMLYVIPFYAIVGTEGAALYAYAYNIYNIFLTNSALMALSTAITITPTSANIASHIFAIPSAPRIRHTPFTARANTIF